MLALSGDQPDNCPGGRQYPPDAPIPRPATTGSRGPGRTTLHGRSKWPEDTSVKDLANDPTEGLSCPSVWGHQRQTAASTPRIFRGSILWQAAMNVTSTRTPLW